jgi:hypothetical protein
MPPNSKLPTLFSIYYPSTNTALIFEYDSTTKYIQFHDLHSNYEYAFLHESVKEVKINEAIIRLSDGLEVSSKFLITPLELVINHISYKIVIFDTSFLFYKIPYFSPQKVIKNIVKDKRIIDLCEMYSIRFAELMVFDVDLYYNDPFIYNYILEKKKELPKQSDRVARALAYLAIQEKEVCPITQEPITYGKISVTSCNCVFQGNPFTKWKQNTCPSCRSPLVYKVLDILQSN